MSTTEVAGLLRGRALTVDPGVFVAAVGGDLEFRASRPDYGQPLTLSQVDGASSDRLRTLPGRLAQGFRGLRRFARATLRDRKRRVVASQVVTFCPSRERQRVSGAGPLLSRYPVICEGAFPFVRGMVWGIDAGWSASLWAAPGLRLRGGALRPGPYVLSVSLADRYRRLLDVPRRAARVRVKVKVERVRRRHRDHRLERGGRPPTAPRGEPSAAAAAAVPTIDATAAETLPDLAALPAFNIVMSNRQGRNLLRFAANSWNAGASDLVIEGFRRPRRATMDAYQYFLDADGQAVGRSSVGTLRYHAAPDHNHWHLLQFAGYSLLDTAGKRVLRARKQSFCLAPTDAVDLTLPDADWLARESSLISACGTPTAIWVRQTLPVGWGDTYSADLPGQAFDVTDLANGRYVIRTEVNPLGLLNERTTSNNRAHRAVRISGNGARRRVSVSAWKGIRD